MEQMAKIFTILVHFCMVYAIAADGLATQGAMVLGVMLLA